MLIIFLYKNNMNQSIILNNLPFEYQKQLEGREQIPFDLLKNLIIWEYKRLKIKNYRLERENNLN